MERELPDYIKRLQAVVATADAEGVKYRAHLDLQFFELKLHIYILFEMLRRRTVKLEQRVAKLEDASPKEIRLPYWDLN